MSQPFREISLTCARCTRVLNKKFKLMLTRSAKACSQIALVYLHPFRRNSLLKCAGQPKIAGKQ